MPNDNLSPDVTLQRPMGQVKDTPNGRRLRLAAEFVLVFVAVPVGLALLLVFGDGPVPIMPTLLVATVAIAVVLFRDGSFDRRQLLFGPGGLSDFWKEIRRFTAWFVVLGALLAAATVVFEPERWLFLPRERTTLWIVIMFAYPVLSVYPQEIVWRTFLHHRYWPIFPTRTAMIAASSLAFGLMHIVFLNWIAVTLTVAGGVLFAHTYERSRSTLAVSIEHALYGCLIFTVGLGWYFYGGAVRG